MNDLTNTTATTIDAELATITAKDAGRPAPKTIDQRIEEAQAAVTKAKEKLFALTKQ